MVCDCGTPWTFLLPFFGVSFMWDKVVLHPYNLYSVCNAYVISRLMY